MNIENIDPNHIQFRLPEVSWSVDGERTWVLISAYEHLVNLLASTGVPRVWWDTVNMMHQPEQHIRELDEWTLARFREACAALPPFPDSHADRLRRIAEHMQAHLPRWRIALEPDPVMFELARQGLAELGIASDDERAVTSLSTHGSLLGLFVWVSIPPDWRTIVSAFPNPQKDIRELAGWILGRFSQAYAAVSPIPDSHIDRLRRIAEQMQAHLAQWHIEIGPDPVMVNLAQQGMRELGIPNPVLNDADG